MGRVEGDLSVMALPDFVIWLANRGLRGELTVERRTNQTVFRVEDGMVVRAASNNPRHYFGQFLIHFGLVTEDQLQRAFGTQRETDVLLGRILVMIGIVPEEKVIQTLRVKFVENLLTAFRWTDGYFRFETREAFRDPPRIDVRVPLVDIHAEGMQRAKVWRDYQTAIPDSSTMFDVDPARAAQAAVNPIDGRLVELAHQGHSVAALGLELHATDYQLAVLLVDLMRRGVLRPRRPSIDVEVPELTGDLTEDHLGLARDAMARREFTAAFRYMQAGARQDPGNPAFGALRAELEQHSRDRSRDVLDRSSVPVLLHSLESQQTRRMSAKQRYLLARIDGRRSVDAIIQVSPMHDFEAIDILQRFAADGLVRLGDT